MPKGKITYLIFLTIFTFINSCGFQVIYKKDDLKESSFEKELAAIRIEKEGGRLTQELRNAIKDTINPDFYDVEPKYVLSLNTSTSVTGTYITATGASGRNKVNMVVTYRLIDANTARLLAIGSTSANDNYDVQTNRYGTYSAEEYSKSNLTKIIASNIRNLLVNDLIELSKNPNKDEPLSNGVYLTDEEKKKNQKRLAESSCDGVPIKPNDPINRPTIGVQDPLLNQPSGTTTQ